MKHKELPCFFLIMCGIVFIFPSCKPRYTVNGHVTITNECTRDFVPPKILKIEIWVYSADSQKVTGVHGETDENKDFSLDAQTEFDADHWKLDKVLDKDGHYICPASKCPADSLKCIDVADNSKIYKMTEKGDIKIECKCRPGH